MMSKAIKNVKEVFEYKYDALPFELLQLDEPVILRGLVSDWPVVAKALSSDEEAVAYIKSFYSGRQVVMFKTAPEKNGRFFYSDDFSSLDFTATHAPLDVVLDTIIDCKKQQSPETYYVGSTTVDTCLPGFRAENDVALNDQNPLVSIWMGNRSCAAAHFDAPDNLACCVAGKRRFTLFPIEQVDNLYIGPLDLTPAGQAVSTVDFNNPDFDKHPKFKNALEHALVAELNPGDALYLPSMWWHQVESLCDVNVLVNYWWRNVPMFMEPGGNLLRFAMLSLRDLPIREKRAWKVLFDHYIFNDNPEAHNHIPVEARGFLNPMNDVLARKLRAWLINKLNR